MRCDDDGIPAFDGVNGFNHRSCFGISRRCKGTDHTHGLRDFYDVALRIFFQDADGLVIDDVHQCCSRLALDLKEFPVVVPKLSLINRELSNLFGDARLGDRPNHRANQIINLFLGVVFDLLLRRARPLNERGNFFCGREALSVGTV